jgi:ribose transport system substrate-binding protein
MSQANNAEPWRAAMNAQIAAAAARYPQLEVRFSDAAQSNATQVADVERFIQDKVNLLIISPNEATPLTNVVARAFDQGIPVIVLDRKVNGDKFTIWIGADNKLIGRRAGAYAAQWCKDNGRAPCQVIELRGLEGSTPATERGDGFREGIATNSDVKIIASQNADWLGDKAILLAEAMLKVNPQVDVVYAHNDPMGEGALKAFTSLGRDPAATLVIGIDALPTPDGGIKSVIDGHLDVTYVYPTGGAEAIDWAVKILEQQAQPPKEVILDTLEVLPANASDLLKSFGGD